MDGTYGDPFTASPIQYDRIAVRTQNDTAVTVCYNRAYNLFRKDSDDLRAIHEAAERVGIRGATQHRLRDTFGTKCFDAGIPAQEVQRLMGHRDIHMTMRYARVSDTRLVQAIESMPPLPAFAS